MENLNAIEDRITATEKIIDFCVTNKVYFYSIFEQSENGLFSDVDLTFDQKKFERLNDIQKKYIISDCTNIIANDKKFSEFQNTFVPYWILQDGDGLEDECYWYDIFINGSKVTFKRFYYNDGTFAPKGEVLLNGAWKDAKIPKQIYYEGYKSTELFLLKDFVLQFVGEQKEIVTMPTWAKESDLQLIWKELFQLKWVDASDEVNFFKAFGVFKDSEPYQKIRIGNSATQLMVFLTLMFDRKDILLSDSNKKIANNLFTIELKNENNLKRNKKDEKKDEFIRWSSKLTKLNELRNADKYYSDYFEPIIQ